MKCRPCGVQMVAQADESGLVSGHECPDCHRSVIMRDAGYSPAVAPVPSKPVTFTPQELQPGTQETGAVRVLSDEERRARRQQKQLAMQESVAERTTRHEYKTCGHAPCGLLFRPKIENQKYCTDVCTAAEHALRQRDKRTRRIAGRAPARPCSRGCGR